MIKYFFIFISIFINAGTSAQSYFNNRFEYGQPGWWDGASNIFKLSDGYVLGGLYQNYCPACLGFYKIDFQGNKIFSKTYCDSITQYYLGNPGSIVRLNPDSILAVGTSQSPTTSWEHDEGVLYFFDAGFDTIETKKFGDKILPVDTAYLFNQLKLDPNNRIMITGIHYPNTTNGRSTILLIKADCTGNPIWQKLYGIGLFYEGESVICTSDGGYAIGGYVYDLPVPPDFSGDPVLIKTDSAGNQQWMLNFGGPWQDTRAMVCNSMDGNIIVGTTYCDSMPGSGPVAAGNAYRRINIIKIDNSGNILWNKKYGSSEGYKELANIRVNDDGSFIACGITTRLFPTTYDYAGWMLKIDTEGDSLWYRQYVVCDGKTSWNWLYDAIQTEENGFIAGGIVYAHPPDTGSYDGWVLKVDSLGCESPSYCWVGMKPEIDAPDNIKVKIFPNPAEKITTLITQPIINGLPVKIRFFDLFGRIVKILDLLPGQTGFQLDVSEFPPGLYVAVIESNGHVIAREKLVVKY